MPLNSVAVALDLASHEINIAFSNLKRFNSKLQCATGHLTYCARLTEVPRLLTKKRQSAAHRWGIAAVGAAAVAAAAGAVAAAVACACRCVFKLLYE